MDKKQLSNLITRKLKEVGLYRSEALNLLLGTAAQESRMGEFIKQLGSGPALGVFQMEPATFNDIVTNFLRYKPNMGERIKVACNVQYFHSEDLEYNLALSILFARLQYYRRPEYLPSSIEGMAAYWKKFYNTIEGKGTEQEFINNYKKYVL